MKVTVEMRPISQIIQAHGMGRNGAVQRFVTNTINRRITRYMPYRSGTLATKLKFIKSPTKIEVVAPYAKYTYYGKVMEGSPPKRVTDRPLNYTKTFHPLAGPFWDRRLIQAEGKAIAKETEKYIGRLK